MTEHTITIRNCNNIRKADISLAEGTLNIKFGYNGTGKSTISEAIRLKMDGKALSGLTPFSTTDPDGDNIPTLFKQSRYLMMNIYASIFSSQMVFLMILIAFCLSHRNAMN